MNQLQQGNQVARNYVMDGRMIRRKGKLVAGNDSNLRQEVLALCHDSAWGGR